MMRDALRRCGLADAKGLHRMAEFVGGLEPGLQMKLGRPGGAWLVAMGPGHLVNKACGLGLDGAVSEAALADLERMFAGAGVDAQVEIWPGSDPRLPAMLEARDYHAGQVLSVLLADPPGAAAPEPAGVDVVRVTPQLAEAYETTVARGFMGQDDGEPGLAERIFARGAARSPEASAWLALVDGVPAGGGALAMRDGVATLFGAGTLPRFRRRGVQAALLARRLRLAHEAGCELAFMKTVPGSGSERNALRAGFRMAGQSVTWARSREVSP